MPTRKTAFDRYVDEKKKSPTFAAEYERVGAEIRAVDDLIRAVDVARLDLGMSKADLARKVSTTPEAMRRLLTSGEANPTLTTVLGVLEALDLRLAILNVHAAEPKSTSKKAASILSKFMLEAKPVRKQSAGKPAFFVSKPASKPLAPKPVRKRATA